MIITKTPYRVSFFGGSTDYREWLEEHDGYILSSSINKYCYLTLRPYPDLFGCKHRIVWSHMESVNTTEEILHPVVREMFNYFDIETGLEVHYQGDLPAKAGMGSSSAFTVGLAHALHYWVYQMQLSKYELAEFAIRFEQEILEETVGSQDQIASAYGGLNFIHLHKGGFEVEPVYADTSELQKCLRLYYLNSGRMSSTITKSLVQNIPQSGKYLQQIGDFAKLGLELVKNKAWDGFGVLLRETWECKKKLTDAVSSPELDKLYQRCLNAGALGGKLLGAGGTGFLLFYVPLNRQEEVDDVMAKYPLVPFGFEDKGCQLVRIG